MTEKENSDYKEFLEAMLDEQQQAMMQSPYAPSPEPPIYMQGDGIPWDHEINVMLPPSYHLQPEKRYPVLWAMDGSAFLYQLPGLLNLLNLHRQLIPELIIVTVGHRGTDSRAEWARKRIRDFYMEENLIADDDDPEDPATQYIVKQSGGDVKSALKDGHADKFLDFLVDDVRSALSERYRMADDHALSGFSGGGFFTARSIFARPGCFDRFIVGSGTSVPTLKLEREYAKNHDDLPATIFVGAGDLEANTLFGAYQRMVSNPVRLVENLHLRQYPSLKAEVRVYRNKDHDNVVPLVFSEGLEFIYESKHGHENSH